MMAFLPDLPVTPGAVMAPGGALPGLPQPGSALDFAGLLNAALPEGETPAPALTNLPAAVPELPPHTPPVSPAQLVSATPILPTAQPLAPPPTPARLPISGKILPDSGEAVPSASIPTTPPSPAPAVARVPIGPEHAAPVIAVQLRAETPGEGGEQPQAINITDADATDEPPVEPGQPVVAAVAVAVPVTLAPAAPPPAPVSGSGLLPTRAAIRTDAARPGAQATPTARAEHQPLPAALTLPEGEGEGESTASPAPAAIPAEASPANAQASSQQSAAATPAFAPQSAAAPVMVERAEPRSPAPQQESAIAQVGELREALRAVRPEMTVRHADFGFVSLRIEPTGTQDWRAVLASRDPGFVPAIHAALAERTVAATSDTAASNNNPGQNGPSDQRYGASPNGGQGSSQPYLSHSGGRNEGQSPQSQNRQPSTTDAVVARAGDAAAERPGRGDRGVFA
jgi:hypothetical protein